MATTFDPFSSNIDPTALTALQRLDLSGPEYEPYTVGVGDGEMTLYRPVNKLPSDYGAIYNSYAGDTGADPTASGFYGPSQVVNGVPVRPYYDAQGSLEKYVGGAAQNLSDSVRLSAEWDPTGKAAPVQWNTDNGLFNSGITFDDAVKTAIIAAVGYNALGPAAGAGGSEAVSGIDLGGVGASPNTWMGGGTYGTVPTVGASTNLDAYAADNIDVGGGWNPATGTGDAATAAAAASTGVTSSAATPRLFTPSGLDVTTGLPTTTTPPTTTTNPLSTLTPAQTAQLAKAGISVAGLLGGAAAVGGLTGGGGGLNLSQQDRSGISSGSAQYSPEYYQQIQAKYNQMMPAQPRDVTTELKNWYETKYAPKVV